MKILHLLYESKGDYFGIGGVGIRAYEIYKFLKERHKITLLCKSYPNSKDGFIDGLEHIYVGSKEPDLKTSLLCYAKEIRKYLKQHATNYDIIIDEFSPAIPSMSHLFTEKTILLQVQGYTGIHYFKKYNFLSALYLYLMEVIRPFFYENLLVINDNTLKRLFKKNYKNILVLPNGIDSSMLQRNYFKGDYILYFARIDYYAKGLDVLLKAFSMVNKRFPHITLVIAGGGRDEDKLEKAVNEIPKSVREKIKITGWLDSEEKKRILKNSLFYVLPSRHETQGITVLEAMACKKAVIVSDIAELSYAVNCGAAVSFKNGSPQSLAQRMIEYLCMDDNLQGKAEKGFQWVEGYTWDKIALRYEEYLQKIIESNRH